MDRPFIGSEALTSGTLNRHQLRTRYESVCPNVYVPKQGRVVLHQRIAAAWLWAKRDATIAGLAAAALHGARWIDDDVPIELVYANTRPPRGVLTRRDVLLDGESVRVGGYLVTTAERTAFDVGRREPRLAAVAHLDALARATGLSREAVTAVAERHPGARGLRNLETVLDLVDAGAQSPRETHLRILLVEAGVARPQTQIPVRTDDAVYYLDMGWPELMVAVEYDGQHHRTDSRQYRKDVRRLEALKRMGWIVIRVIAGDRPSDIVRRVRDALDERASSV